MRAKLVAFNAVINTAMQVIPVTAALICIPLAIDAFGVPFFGFYTLIIAAVMLFNYLNFGIANALTQQISKRLGEQSNSARSEIRPLIRSGLLLMVLIAVLISIGLFLGMDTIIEMVGIQNQAESARIMIWFLILGSPVIMVVITLRAVLESYQKFAVTSTTRALINAMIFIAPVLAGGDAKITALSLLATYILTVIVLTFFLYRDCLDSVPSSQRGGWIRLLIGIGSTFLLISITMAFNLYYDRYIIGIMLSLETVTSYSAAYDVISRLTIISGSMTAVLFPAISFWKSSADSERINQFVRISYRLIPLLIALACWFLMIFASELIELWLGASFLPETANLVHWLCFGIYFVAISTIGFRLLVAVERQHQVAIIYGIASVTHVVISTVGVIGFGLIGALVGYIIAAFVEFMLFLYFSNRFGYDFRPGASTRLFVLIQLQCLFMLLAALWLADSAIEWRLLVSALLIVVLGAFHANTLTTEERAIVKTLIKRV